MGEQKPEAKDRLGKDIENGVGNDFGIESNKTPTIGNTPDTEKR